MFQQTQTLKSKENIRPQCGEKRWSQADREGEKEIEDSKNQREIFGWKNTITEIKVSVAKLNNTIEKTLERIYELEDIEQK